MVVAEATADPRRFAEDADAEESDLPHAGSGTIAMQASVGADEATGGSTMAGGDDMTVWFTVELEDRPGALAQVASALGDRGVNITGIVGVAEDTGGALMLTTSDPTRTREAFDAIGIAFEEHDESAGLEPGRMSVEDVRGRGAAAR
jgi:hypothetical protein